MTDPAVINIVHHDGIHPTMVDLMLCRAPTKPCRWWRIIHILDEMQIAAASQNKRRR